MNAAIWQPGDKAITRLQFPVPFAEALDWKIGYMVIATISVSVINCSVLST